MPIECVLLEDRPVPIETCPKCGMTPFEPFIRGTVQRRKKKFFFFGEEWPYCALICSHCKEIVDYESPPKLVYDSETVYAKKRCKICKRSLKGSFTIVTRHYPDGKHLDYHLECYRAFPALLPPFPPSNP